jgi:hypothetical protein
VKATGSLLSFDAHVDRAERIVRPTSSASWIGLPIAASIRGPTSAPPPD